MSGAVPSTWPGDSPVIEPDPVKMYHQGRLHVYVSGHMRSGFPIKPHWRPLAQPQSMAPPSNSEPVELFGGKQS